MNQVLNEFLGGMSAIVIENYDQLQKLKEFMGMKNLFLSDGTPAAQLNVNVIDPIAFYRDPLGMFVGYDAPNNVSMNYSLKNFNEAFNQQMDMFGDSSIGIIRKHDEDLINDEIEAKTNEVKNEFSLAETLNQLEIGEIQPATVTGNIIEFKDTVIRAIDKYKGIVVTKDNFQELTATRADLNNKKQFITDNRKNMKKEALKNIDTVYNAMSEIIKAIENVVDPLNTDIKKFEDEEKKALKNNVYEKTINPMLDMLFSKQMIDDGVRKQFEFKDSWLNKTSFTKSGDFVKKVKEEMNTEFERLVALHQQHLNDIATIESTVKQLSLAHKLDAELKADTYIDLYMSGLLMPQINERINQDIEVIKKTVNAVVEKQTQNIQFEQQITLYDQQVGNTQNAADANDVTILSDEKTGEVLAKGDNQKLMALVTQTPEKQQGKMFEYTYTFSGPFGVIKTFSNILKLLSKMFKDFKYERVGK